MSDVTCTEISTTELRSRSRSQRLRKSLLQAFGGGRAVALTGQPGDVLVATDGSLLRLAQWLALEEASRGSALLNVDAKKGSALIVPPQTQDLIDDFKFSPGPIASVLVEIATRLKSCDQPVTVFIDFCCLELEGDDGTLLRWLLEVSGQPSLSNRGHRVVACFPSALPPPSLLARPGWTVVNVDLPDQEERRFVLQATHRKSPTDFRGVDLDHVALTLGGVGADALLRLAEESRGSAVDAERIGEVKSAEITRTAAGTIEVLRAGDGNLAGLWNLRYYLAGRQAAELPIGPILLCGPPGCGKTLSFMWLARQLGLPAVKLGQLRGPYVGTSEENWLRARRTLEACSPVCVLLDEVEMIGLGVRGANMDSGVSDRMREGLLGILNDASDLGIVFVLASNNPAGIDVAGINRAVVLPVLNPTVNEAVEILNIEANKRLWALESNAALEVLTRRKELLTGRGLVRLLHSAAVIAARHKRAGTILGEDLQLAFDLSLEAGDSPRQEYMALCALAHAESRDAWPWVAAMALGQSPEIPPYVRQLMDSDGELNLVSLRQRINDLKTGGYGF